MRFACFLALTAFVASFSGPCVANEEKPRVLVLTDIENEPDDAMSMVRFLVYSNQWDVEGLVATTSVHQGDKTAAWRIREIVEAYGGHVCVTGVVQGVSTTEILESVRKKTDLRQAG